MEDWKTGRLEEWKDATAKRTGMMEYWNSGRMEKKNKDGIMEGWKNRGKGGRMEEWKTGRLAERD